MCWTFLKNKANFEFNAARCTINLTPFYEKIQAVFALVILDALLNNSDLLLKQKYLKLSDT